MESTAIRLLGPADDAAPTDSKSKQYMQIDLDEDVLDELISCAKRGKAPHVILGRNPVCCSLYLRCPLTHTGSTIR
jgi:hypothetical protein